ncbi:GNAT family N-acetyltransferase [Methanobrevibacter sp.]|uniref:GNAT family N-acetyltransferase n=1 Tax=Methanobrevibacter sp. TaxID=66852 RepID=UPI00386BE68B
MDTILTDENDKRFLELVNELDRGYYERIGNELSKYDSYNEFKNPHVVLLALDKGIPVACASYRAFDDVSVEFKRVYTKREYRRRGMAYNLITQLEKSAVKNGYRFSYIITGKNNKAAISLYKKLNYKFIDNFGQFKDDNVVICMKKEFK